MKRPKPVSRSRPQEISAYTKAMGVRLRVERQAQGIGLVDLATAVGCSVNTLRWHETGSRMLRADELASVAKHLRLDPQIMMVPHYEDRESDADIRAALGKRMQAARAHAGYSQLQLVRDAGITIISLQHHEAGSNSMRVGDLLRIAIVFKIDPCDLMRL